jgi:uncharacterized protein DUF1553/uncharacterized protein DUF1549/cytochrome c
VHCRAGAEAVKGASFVGLFQSHCEVSPLTPSPSPALGRGEPTYYKMASFIQDRASQLGFTHGSFQRFSLLFTLVSTAAPNWVAAQASPQFEKQVLPVLSKYCLTCHGAAMQMGKLDLRTLASMTRGGEHGPALAKGSAEKSRLFQRITDKSMPPTENKVTDDEARIIRDWIDGGAKTAEAVGSAQGKAGTHWAFQPPLRPAIPKVALGGNENPIDAFVLARLEKASLKPAAQADKRTLLRRIYLDLIGLLPTLEEQQVFLNDRSPDAYSKVVDSLLARPQYGERWARHWLDVVRYAESNGYERDGAKPSAWRYRDYVIKAFNQDKGFDRFLTEQLAGDEIEGANAETQIATTFLRLGTYDDEPAEPQLDRYDQLDDVLGTTAASFLGLTLRCARCHDHKFEPLKQSEYYRMLAVFEPLKRPLENKAETDRLVGTEAELAAYRKAMAQADAAIAPLRQELDQQKKTLRDRLFKKKDASFPGVPFLEHAEIVLAFQTEPGKRSKEQKELVEKFNQKLEEAIRGEATAEEKLVLDDRQKQIAAIDAARPKEPKRGYIWYEESAKAPVTHLLRRGDPTDPGEELQPGIPAVLTQGPLEAPVPLKQSSGRRLWLAHWMTSPSNPLVARVLVNRVWQWHFGEGLVASENDFGVVGQRPSHPELLDFLATEFIQSGWSLKRLHRLIVSSRTYQASSEWNAQAAKVDPENILLWRWKPRRLEAEAIRDTTLAVSGDLNLEMGGPSIYPQVPQTVLASQSRPGDGWGKSDEKQAARRSVYIFAKRSLAVPELEVLDTPDTTSSCEQRAVSTTGPQALTFLNGEFAHQQARHFAERLSSQAGLSAKDQIERAFELALSRPPDKKELKAATDFLDGQRRRIEADGKDKGSANHEAGKKALEAFCLVLLNTNEFFFLN